MPERGMVTLRESALLRELCERSWRCGRVEFGEFIGALAGSEVRARRLRFAGIASLHSLTRLGWASVT
jgi:hypothetical protein